MEKMKNITALFLITLFFACAGFCSDLENELAELASPAEDSGTESSLGSDSGVSGGSDLAEGQEEQTSFGKASMSIHDKLEASIAELNELREQVAEVTIPLSKKLSELEAELVKVRGEYQDTARLLDTRTLNLSNLRSEIKRRKQEGSYLSNLLGEYVRNFESRLHIAELQRFEEEVEKAKLAAENSNLSEGEVYAAQAGLVSLSLDRLEEAAGGVTFEGRAVDPSGLVKQGKFLMIGPSALFESSDGEIVGTAEQRLGSLEPAVVPFGNPLDAEAASNVISQESGSFPFDPTLGNAHKIEDTEEPFLAHVQKGGPVMYPIFGLAGAAVLVAMFKWLHMMLVRMPSQKRIRNLLGAVARHDEQEAFERSKKIHGPVGKMLRSGLEHIKEPTELIEEVMYEKVLSTRLSLERFLPFIAITAASAPLLGLLGTVTGIINTFKLITVFGSGDVKMLSGGISEALITTKFGLIVAIPALLLHAFLSRKAKGIINRMEKAAVAFVNQVTKTPWRKNGKQSGDGLSAEQYEEILRSIKGGMRIEEVGGLGGVVSQDRYSSDTAGSVMDDKVVSIGKKATVGEAIGKIRSGNLGREIDNIFVVDDSGKYAGNVPVRRLLTVPEQAYIDSLAEANPHFVRVDTNRREVEDMFKKYDMVNIPVVDHKGQLVGSVSRGGNGAGKSSGGNGDGKSGGKQVKIGGEIK